MTLIMLIHRLATKTTVNHEAPPTRTADADHFFGTNTMIEIILIALEVIGIYVIYDTHKRMKGARKRHQLKMKLRGA